MPSLRNSLTEALAVFSRLDLLDADLTRAASLAVATLSAVVGVSYSAMSSSRTSDSRAGPGPVSRLKSRRVRVPQNGLGGRRVKRENLASEVETAWARSAVVGIGSCRLRTEKC